ARAGMSASLPPSPPSPRADCGHDGCKLAARPRRCREMPSEAAKRRLVWFVTGASRGVGLELARQGLARGGRLVATARNPRPLESELAGSGSPLLALPLDVSDEAQARAAVDHAVARFGRIDVLVNNAGRGLLGAVEEASTDEVRAVFDTNVVGLLTV